MPSRCVLRGSVETICEWGVLDFFWPGSFSSFFHKDIEAIDPFYHIFERAGGAGWACMQACPDVRSPTVLPFEGNIYSPVNQAYLGIICNLVLERLEHISWYCSHECTAQQYVIKYVPGVF